MTRSWTIAPATFADANSLWRLLEPAFRAGDTYAIEPDISRGEALSYWTGAPNRVWLAWDGPTPLGTFYLRPNQRGGGAHVANAGFVTAEAARGRGVARAMLSLAEADAVRCGFNAMQFNFVVETNAPALHLWRRCGYREVGRLPGAFRHPAEGVVDALVLHKPLAAEE
jgi:ribosomal protein S18 acetylase RimI-like enzyme